MDTNTIFMWTAGAAATITTGFAIRAAWKEYNAAIAEASTLRFQLERAHTLVDQMTDQCAAMNRTISELRSELKTAKAKQAVADIDAKAARQKTWGQASITPTPVTDTMAAAKAHIEANEGLSRQKTPTFKWIVQPKAKKYDKIFSSPKVADWLANAPWGAVDNAAKNRSTEGNIEQDGAGGGWRFLVQHKRVRYCTPYFRHKSEVIQFRRRLFRAFDVEQEVYL